MLQIAFLVTFCGLLLQMAQATEMPCNYIPVILSCDTFTTPVVNRFPKDIITPMPPSAIENNGNTYTDLTNTEQPTLVCKTTTRENNVMIVELEGKSKINGKMTYSQSTAMAPCEVNSAISVAVPLTMTPEGGVQCGKMPSSDQVKVTCTSKPGPLGLLGGVLQLLLSILGGLLNVLSNTITGLIAKEVPILLNSLQGTLDSILGLLTGITQVDGTMNCKRAVKNMNTDTPNCIYMTMESIRTSATDGSIITPPPQTYNAPTLTLPTGSSCAMAISEIWINHVLGSYTTGPYEVTGVTVLATLSTTVSSICGKPLTIIRLVFKPTGPLQLTITANGITATQPGSFCVYAAGSDAPFLTATAVAMFTVQVTVKAGCVTMILTFDSMINVKLIPGQTTCDVAYQASLTFTAELKGKLVIEKCVEPSPVADLPITGKPTCTPGDGHVRVTYPN